MYRITNAEYSILAILLERGRATGYEIDKIVEARGFREWAAIGKTSVYVALKKLEHKGLAEGKLNRSKTGKGPAGRQFSVTKAGSSLFREETKRALATSREREHYFALGIAGSFVLSQPVFKHSLEKRVDMLEGEYERISRRMLSEESLTLQAQLLFDYTLSRIRAEISFTNETMSKLMEDHDDN